jgi:aerobic-type carbon monoxide dehydrogenase small subunit (CoxS/CutS family)
MNRPSSGTVTVNGTSLNYLPGETITGLLRRYQLVATRVTPLRAESRGYFCGMGACFECTVLVDGSPQRACMLTVQTGQRIEFEHGLRTIGADDD